MLHQVSQGGILVVGEKRAVVRTALETGTQVFLHHRHELAALLGRQAREVPHIAVIPQPEQHFLQHFALRVMPNEAQRHVEFLAYVHSLLRIVHRRRLVVLAVMQNRLFAHSHLLRFHPHFELKAQVLIAGTRRFQETHAALIQHFTTIQCRPNGRNAVEHIALVARIEGLRRHGRRAHAYKLIALFGRAPVEPIVRFCHVNGRVIRSDLRQAMQQLQGIGLEEVIRLKNANVLAARCIDAQIHRGTIAGIIFVNQTKALIVCHIALDNV